VTRRRKTFQPPSNVKKHNNSIKTISRFSVFAVGLKFLRLFAIGAECIVGEGVLRESVLGYKNRRGAGNPTLSPSLSFRLIYTSPLVAGGSSNIEGDTVRASFFTLIGYFSTGHQE
jgi:hypothetical protein